MKKLQAKSFKIEKNEVFCSGCNSILTISEDIASDEFIQCPSCETVMKNPLLSSGKYISCPYCGSNSEIPKKLENTLILNCPDCHQDFFNLDSPDYKAITCPNCNMQVIISPDLVDVKYIRCLSCGFEPIKNVFYNSSKKPALKQTETTSILENSETFKEPSSSKYDFAETKSPRYSDKSDKRFIWLIGAAVVLVFLIISYFAERDNPTMSGNYSGSRSGSTNSYSQRWYEGGTLHKATISEWKMASDRNKLATCADFISSSNPRLTERQLRIVATELKNCIDEGVYGYQGVNNLKVAEIGALCMSAMGYE